MFPKSDLPSNFFSFVYPLELAWSTNDCICGMMFENHRAAFERLMITGFLSKRTFKLFLTFLPKDTKYENDKTIILPCTSWSRQVSHSQRTPLGLGRNKTNLVHRQQN